MSIDIAAGRFGRWLKQKNIDEKKVTLIVMADDIETMAQVDCAIRQDFKPYILGQFTYSGVHTIGGINLRLANRDDIVRALAKIKDAL